MCAIYGSGWLGCKHPASEPIGKDRHASRSVWIDVLIFFVLRHSSEIPAFDYSFLQVKAISFSLIRRDAPYLGYLRAESNVFPILHVPSDWFGRHVFPRLSSDAFLIYCDDQRVADIASID